MYADDASGWKYTGNDTNFTLKQMIVFADIYKTFREDQLKKNYY